MPVQILSIGAGHELVPAVVRIFFLFRVEDFSVFVTGDKRGGAPGVFRGVELHGGYDGEIGGFQTHVKGGDGLLLTDRVGVDP